MSAYHRTGNPVGVAAFGHPRQRRLSELADALLEEARSVATDAMPNARPVDPADALAAAFQMLAQRVIQGPNAHPHAGGMVLEAICILLGYSTCKLPEASRPALYAEVSLKALHYAADSAAADALYCQEAGHA